MLNRYQQQQLVAIMLVAPLFFVGKIMYSFKLIYVEDNRHIGSIYSEKGLELIRFSVQFLGPLLWQLCVAFQYPPKKKSLHVPGKKVRLFFSFILVTSISLNFPLCGVYRIIGTILSVSALLHTIGIF